MARKKTPASNPNPKTPKPGEGEEETDLDGEGEGDGDEDDEDQDRKINAIVTSRVNRALKPLTKTIEALTSRLEALSQPRSTDEDEEETDEEPAPRKGKSGGESKKLTALERRLKDAEDRAAKAEQAQKDQAEKALRQEENASISAALTKAGVTDPRVVRAITLALREEEMIVRDEETGRVRFKTVDKYGTEDFVDPDSGVAKWLKSDGKAFLPAVPASGSGAGGSDAASVQQTKMSAGEIGKLSARERAAIEIDRASRGLPPLGQD